MNQYSKLSAGDDADVIAEKIINSISASKYVWRTAKSLAKEIGANEALVKQTMIGSDNFVRARRPNSQGEFLYTTRDRYRTGVPFSQRLFGAAANTVSQ